MYGCTCTSIRMLIHSYHTHYLKQGNINTVIIESMSPSEGGKSLHSGEYGGVAPWQLELDQSCDEEMTDLVSPPLWHAGDWLRVHPTPGRLQLQVGVTLYTGWTEGAPQTENLLVQGWPHPSIGQYPLQSICYGSEDL